MWLFIIDGGLSGGESCYWYSEGGATYIVEADLVAEVDGCGVSAVFSADTEFEVLFDEATFTAGHVYEYAYA